MNPVLGVSKRVVRSEALLVNDGFTRELSKLPTNLTIYTPYVRWITHYVPFFVPSPSQMGLKCNMLLCEIYIAIQVAARVCVLGPPACVLHSCMHG